MGKLTNDLCKVVPNVMKLHYLVPVIELTQQCVGHEQYTVVVILISQIEFYVVLLYLNRETMNLCLHMKLINPISVI